MSRSTSKDTLVTENPDAIVRKRVRPVFGKMRNVMPETMIPKGYQGRWFNDVNDRIFIKLREGWDFLTVDGQVKLADKGVKDAKQSGELMRKNVGGGVEAFFMVITNEWYAEDRKAFHDQIRISKQNINKENTEQGGVYGGAKVTDEMVT